MPLTDKGRRILRKMVSEYGARRGKSVFYASQNAGTISGVEGASPSPEAIPGMPKRWTVKRAKRA